MNKTNYIVAGSAIASVAAMIFAFVQMRETRRVTKKLDTATDYILSKTDFEVADTLIEVTTRECVENSVDYQAKLAAKEVRLDMERDIRAEVSKAVEEMKDDVRDDVRAALERKAKQVTVTDIKNEVVSDLKKRAEKKVDDKIDDIVEKHTEQLSEITKIYNTIGHSMASLSKGA